MSKNNEVRQLVEDLKCGNVFDMDVLTMWNSKKLQQIRAWQMANLIPICSTCPTSQLSNSYMKYMRTMLVQDVYI